VLRRVVVLLLAAALTALVAIAVAGHDPEAGRVIWNVSDRHGLHSGDLLPLGIWAVGLIGCLVLWRDDR
jgi:hypothetical protein